MAKFLFLLIALARVCFGSEAYDPAKATGTIKGDAKFLGDVPVMRKFDILDPAILAYRKDLPPLKDEEVVVSADNKVANLVVYVSKGHEAFSFDAQKKALARSTSKAAQFFPHVLCVMTGQEVELESADSLIANWHIEGKENPGINVAQAKPGIYPMKPVFKIPELNITIRNDALLWESSKICVFAHPFFAVTKQDGTFEIKLPPGAYELSFWHESSKVVVPEPMKIIITADKTTEVSADVKALNYRANRLTEKEQD